MSYRLPSYLHRNRHGTLYFRMAVPNLARQTVGQKEIYRSLGTASVRQAANTAQALRVALGAIFKELIMELVAEGQNLDQRSPSAPSAIDGKRLSTLMQAMKRVLKAEGERDLIAGENELLRQVILKMKTRNERELDIAIKSKGASSGPLSGGAKMTLSEVWSAYKGEKIAAQAWKDGEDTAKNDHWPHVRALIEVIGDKAIGSVTADDVNQFQSHVLTDTKGGSPRNRDKRLTRAGAVLRFAKKKRWIHDAFAELFCYPGKIEENPYKAFDLADLKALFESEEYRAGLFETPSEYWLPVLALHTGARLNELCQLTPQDIGVHDGIQTIAILDDDLSKRLKTTASRRIVPIHSTLIACGFLDFVKATKTDRLFPELPENPARRSDYTKEASRKFTAYRRKQGVGAISGRSDKAFHSFRSTLISVLRKANVPGDRRRRLAGHEAEDVHDKNYTGGDVLTMFDFATLKGDIEKARFDICFTPYRCL